MGQTNDASFISTLNYPLSAVGNYYLSPTSDTTQPFAWWSMKGFTNMSVMIVQTGTIATTYVLECNDFGLSDSDVYSLPPWPVMAYPNTNAAAQVALNNTGSYNLHFSNIGTKFIRVRASVTTAGSATASIAVSLRTPRT